MLAFSPLSAFWFHDFCLKHLNNFIIRVGLPNLFPGFRDSDLDFWAGVTATLSSVQRTHKHREASEPGTESVISTLLSILIKIWRKISTS